MNEHTHYAEHTRFVTINKKGYSVENHEFPEIKSDRFSNLRILKDVDKYERITALLYELTKATSANTYTHTHTLLCINITHGGFMAINSANNFDGKILSNLEINSNILSPELCLLSEDVFRGATKSKSSPPI